MVRNRIIAALVSVVALVSMTGCSNATANVAATVDGYVITEKAVRGAAAGMTEMLGSDPRFDGSDFVGFVLQSAVVGRMVTEALDQMGSPIADDVRDQYWNQVYQDGMVEYPLWTDSRTRSAMVAMVDWEIVNDMAQNGKIDGNRFMELFNGFTVTVNPRYGTWDPDNMWVTSRTTGAVGNPLADPTVFAVPSPS